MNTFLQQLTTYGFTVLPPDIASPGGLHEKLLRDVVSVASDEAGPFDVANAPHHILADNPSGQQLFYLLARGGAYIDIVNLPAQLELVRHLIGDAILSSVTATLKGCGDVALPLHADQPIHPTPRSLVCTAAYLLTSMSAAEGGLFFVPGSHHQMRQPSANEQNLAMQPGLHSIEAPAGSLVIWHANTWHGAHARSIPGVRVALLVHWCSALLRTQEPYRELLPDAIIEAGGEGFADLLGASLHYGWTESGPSKQHHAAFHNARTRPNANTKIEE